MLPWPPCLLARGGGSTTHQPMKLAPRSSLRQSFGMLLLLAAVLCSRHLAGNELVRNGSFGQVMAEWGIPPDLQPWYPYQHPAGRVALHPDAMAYNGTVLYQSLNVTGIASQTMQASIDLGADWALPPGQSYSVVLEYLDNTATRQFATVIAPDNTLIPVGSMSTFTGSVLFPANAVKLVGLAIVKSDYGDAYGDNVSLTHPSLTGGPVPAIQSSTPSAVNYGGQVTLTGTNFGATTGSVSVGDSAAGVTIDSWSDTQIVLTLNDPCMGGAIIATTGGVRTTQARTVGIATPHFRVRTQGGPFVCTPGQTVRVPVFVDYRSGFSPADGPVSLTAPTPPAPVTFLPSNVADHGGSFAIVNTTGLAAGTHSFTVQGTAAGVLLPRTAPFDVEVHTVSSLTASYIGASSSLPLSGAVFTAQGAVTLSASIKDQNNTEVSHLLPFPSWSSSNPSVADIFMDSAPWGGAQLLVNNTGSATITVTLPGGSSWNFPITVSLPSTPRVLSHAFGAAFTDNSGSTENSLYFLADNTITSFNWGVSSLGMTFGDGSWGDGGASYFGKFTVNPGQLPGQYLFYGNAGTFNGPLKSSVKLTVFNAASKGLLQGRVAISSGDSVHGEASGELEFYDAGTGTLAFTKSIWSMSADFTGAYLTPGSYKLKWTSSAPGPGYGLSQWYPNAAAFASAQAVGVSAGGSVGEVNFFLNPVEVIPVAPVITQAPVLNPTTHTFGMQAATETGVTYLLQKSYTLLEDSWFTIATIVGNGAAQAFEDAQATEPAAFYRIVRVN